MDTAAATAHLIGVGIPGKRVSKRDGEMKARDLMSNALVPLLLAACGGGDSTSPPPTNHAIVWSSVASGTTQVLFGVWGSSPSDVWAVGNAAVLHYNGSRWSSLPIGASQVAYGVWGTSPTNVWVVGNDGTPLHYDGTNWARGATLPILSLQKVWGTSPSNVWAVVIDRKSVV